MGFIRSLLLECVCWPGLNRGHRMLRCVFLFLGFFLFFLNFEFLFLRWWWLLLSMLYYVALQKLL